MSKAILSLFGAFLLLCPGVATSEQITPRMDLVAVRVEVTWYATANEVRAALEAAKVKGTPRGGVNGFSFTTADGVCHIHAVRPKEVDRAGTTTVGHEVLHCLLGQYHRAIAPFDWLHLCVVGRCGPSERAALAMRDR